MKTYKVDGRLAVIDVGEVVRLTAAQFDARSHNVDLLREQSGTFFVRVRLPLQFKKGEQIGVESVPRELASVLLPIEGDRAPERAGR
jgi:hypothetical protein